MRFSVAAVALASLAVASPMHKTRQTSINVVDQTLSVVDSAGATIVSQLTDITNLLVGTLTGSVVPQLETSLTAVGAEFDNINSFVTGQLQDTIAPLAEAELQNVLSLLQDTTDLVNKAKSTLEDLTSGLLKSTLSGVKDEAQYLLDTIEPAVTPVLEISKDLVGSATGSVVDQINGLAGDLNTLVTNGLAPVQEAINKLV